MGVEAFAILITESVLNNTMGRREGHRYQLDVRICRNTHALRNRRLSLQVKGKMLLISVGLQATYQKLHKGRGGAFLMEISCWFFHI